MDTQDSRVSSFIPQSFLPANKKGLSTHSRSNSSNKDDDPQQLLKKSPEDNPRLLDIHSDYFPPLEIVWRNVALFSYLHLASFFALTLIAKGHFHWNTLIWTGFLHICGAFGITAGAHRLWAHKAYKATLPLRIFLGILQTLAFQNSIYEWCRDHRVHHKFSDTHADPHNSQRGFFFSHMGWLLSRKHPLVSLKGRGIDMSDLQADPVVRFQNRHYLTLVALISFLIPSSIPCIVWEEFFVTSFFLTTHLRYCTTLHVTWLVNSAAHIWGSKPYDKDIQPAENKAVSFLALGEGWHNYHHTFPWDYKAAELGPFKLNFTTAILNIFARLGLAYDLKSVDPNVVARRAARTGNGTHQIFPASEQTHKPQQVRGAEMAGPWGWGDVDISHEDSMATVTLFHNTQHEVPKH